MFESAQAVPLFIVYTDPAIPVAAKIEEKKLNLHTSLLSPTQKSAEKETGLLFFSFFFRFSACQKSFISSPKSLDAGNDSIRKENESLKHQLIKKEQEKQEAFKAVIKKDQEKLEAIEVAMKKNAEIEEMKTLLLEMRKKLEKKK